MGVVVPRLVIYGYLHYVIGVQPNPAEAGSPQAGSDQLAADGSIYRGRGGGTHRHPVDSVSMAVFQLRDERISVPGQACRAARRRRACAGLLALVGSSQKNGRFMTTQLPAPSDHRINKACWHETTFADRHWHLFTERPGLDRLRVLPNSIAVSLYSSRTIILVVRLNEKGCALPVGV